MLRPSVPMLFVCLPLLAASLAACGPEQAPSVRCADAATLQTCDGDGCRNTACRVDQVCDQDACRAWDASRLFADFDIEPDPNDPKRIAVVVHEGGFPRVFAEEIRFTFGDGKAGWGERVSHRYAKPGVYPVELGVRLDGYRLLRATRLVTIAPVPAAHVPATFTVNDIPDYLNGSLSYRSNAYTPSNPADDYDRSFHLLLPHKGFTVDVTLTEPAPGAVQRESLSLVANRDLGDGRVKAGTNLADRLVFEGGPALRVPRASWLVGDGDAFPAGMVSLVLSGRSADGTSFERTLSFEIMPLTPRTDPFDRDISWLFDFEADKFTVGGRIDEKGSVHYEVKEGADGEPDFAQELRLMGAQGTESAPGAGTVQGAGAVGANAIYRELMKAEIIREVRLLYRMAPDGTARDGIRFGIFTAGSPGAPDPGKFKEDGDFSLMRFGGTQEGSFGRSWISWYNDERIDDTEPDVGIATANILSMIVGTNLLTTQFNPIKPGFGVPVGEHPLDAVVLADSFDRWSTANSAEANQRWDDLHSIARMLGIAIGAVTAHEMGHAMGLMADGVPPFGLFGDVQDCPFIGPATDGAHADLPGLNVMQAGASILNVLAEFNQTVEVPEDIDVVGLGLLTLKEMRMASYETAYFKRALTYYR